MLGVVRCVALQRIPTRGCRADAGTDEVLASALTESLDRTVALFIPGL